MEYRPASLDEAETIRHFMHRMGWSHRIRDAESFRTLLRNSDRTATAWDGAKVVGFARALCDDVSNGYISMVAVDPAYHGRGIGGTLIETLLNNDFHMTWVLRASHDSREFWEHFGFKPSEFAMERVREY